MRAPKPGEKKKMVYDDTNREVVHSGETVEEFLARGGVIRKMPTVGLEDEEESAK